MRKSLFTLLLSFYVLPFLLCAQDPENTRLTDRLKSHVSILASDSLEGRGLGTEGKILAKNYIAEQFRSAGLRSFNTDYFQHFNLRIGLARVPATNVVGYLPGSDPDFQEEYILLGAHYDHLGYEDHNGQRVIYSGADDNASGVAVLIELAAYFSQNPELTGRSIIFVAFDAEESGLLGSEIFIDKNEVLVRDKIKMMFSLDMVGMYDANSGLELPGIGTLDNGDNLAREVALAHDIRLRKTTSDIPARTDTRPFGNIGVPAAQVFTGLESPYHQPGDTYDLLDYDGMAMVTRYLQSLVAEISMMPDPAPSRQFARLQRPYGLRFNPGVLANIGSSNHKFPDEFFDANNVFAFSTGFFMHMQVGQKFSIQPEFLYDYNGSKSPDGSYRRHSLTIPVNLQYYLAGDDSGLVRVYPITGVYFRYNFAGEDGGTDLDFDNLHPAWERGVNLGIGIDIMKVQVAFTWRRGLTDISAMSGIPAFNTGRYLTVGYRF